MNTDTTFRVTEIQRFCMHDGPGVRTTVFLKGCPLRCAWCHNPETQRTQPEMLFYPNKCLHCGACASSCVNGAHRIDARHTFDRTSCVHCAACASACPTGALELCGKTMTIQQILDVVEKDRAFYGKNGGITLSGGEPLAHGMAVVQLLKACKERGLTTAVETCGQVDPAVLTAAIPYADTFLWDIKDTDSQRHKQYTGSSNDLIIKNLLLADELQAKTRLRCILVAGVNTDDTHYGNLAKLAAALHNTEGVEFLPYHPYGGSKNTFLGQDDNGSKDWIPTPEQVEYAQRTVERHNIPVIRRTK